MYNPWPLQITVLWVLWIFWAGTQQQEFQELFFNMQTADTCTAIAEVQVTKAETEPDPRLSEWELLSVQTQESDFKQLFPLILLTTKI